MGILLLIGLVLVLLSRKSSAALSNFLTEAAAFLTDIFPVLGKAQRLLTTALDGITAAIDKALASATPCLAWLWMLCLLFTLADWYTPLEFAGLYPRSVAHFSLWGLGFFAARYFGRPYTWPVRLWRSTLVLAVGVVVLWPLTFPFIMYGAGLFWPQTSWRITCVYFQRGNTVVVDQRRGQAGASTSRRVVLHPITPLFNWVEPLAYQDNTVPPPRPAGEGWVAVNKQAADFSPDPIKQLELDNAKKIERQCWADRRRTDSLALCGQLPLEARTLPAATRHGANTIGCLTNGEVWRNYLVLPRPGECRQAGAVGIVQKPGSGHPGFSFTLSAIMRIGNIYRFLTLRLPVLQGPGVYALSNDVPATNSPEAAHLTLSSQKTVGYTTTKTDYITTTRFPGTVIITRFDTVARVVSGTFQGSVYDLSNSVGPRPVTQGRFDVHYYYE